MRTKEEIREQIIKLGLKKKFVAEQCGIGISKFSLYLKGERTLRPNEEEILNKFLDNRK